MININSLWKPVFRYSQQKRQNECYLHPKPRFPRSMNQLAWFVCNLTICMIMEMLWWFIVIFTYQKVCFHRNVQTSWSTRWCAVRWHSSQSAYWKQPKMAHQIWTYKSMLELWMQSTTSHTRNIYVETGAVDLMLNHSYLFSIHTFSHPDVFDTSASQYVKRKNHASHCEDQHLCLYIYDEHDDLEPNRLRCFETMMFVRTAEWASLEDLLCTIGDSRDDVHQPLFPVNRNIRK